MYLLYSFFILMLSCGIGFLAIPFITTNTISSKYFLLSAIFMILFSLGLYQFNGNQTTLKQWLMYGEKHYRLQQEVNQLGGFAGIIEKIKKKLAENPDDAEGWFILGKLYLANQDYNEAKEALGNAVALQPNNSEIKRFYNMAVEKTK